MHTIEEIDAELAAYVAYAHPANLDAMESPHR
jgi:hypothetical protein